MPNFFKSVGKSIKHGSKSVGHLLKNSEHKVEGAVGTVYKDAKSAVAYGGKHLINDVDTISSSFSNSIIIIGAVVAGIFVMSKM